MTQRSSKIMPTKINLDENISWTIIVSQNTICSLKDGQVEKLLELLGKIFPQNRKKLTLEIK